MGEGGFSELFGGPPTEVARAKKSVPVPGLEPDKPKGKSFWRPFRLLDPDKPIEMVPKQGPRNVPAAVDVPEEKARELGREAAMKKAEKKAAKNELNSLKSQFRRLNDRNDPDRQQRSTIEAQIAGLDAILRG